ncbi:response regulator [Pseudomaricurvus sp. HS19]|uniref:response regulator n=1 Tax=Pseudomaricurvus sp. HS19 TaxID=2692626 RepID=UPI0013690E93|nr:response regulator [Pseudomaricurvus sp. HS19]MYM64363.1 response regulator [Pseudomaricurvus sp. HS19]
MLPTPPRYAGASRLLLILLTCTVAHSANASDTFQYLFDNTVNTVTDTSTAALLGALVMLVVINLAQAWSQKEKLNLWLALQIASISLLIGASWVESHGQLNLAPHWLNPRTFMLLAISTQLCLVLRWPADTAPPHRYQQLFVGVQLILLAALALLPGRQEAHLFDSHWLFFASMTLSALYLLQLGLQGAPLATQTGRLKLALITVASVCYWWFPQAETTQPLAAYWLSLLLAIIDATFCTYAVIRISINSAQRRLQQHYQRALHARLRRQYTNTLKQAERELRTPLSGMVGTAELLLESPLSRSQMEQVNTLRRAGEGLLKWLNRIHDWRSLEKGSLSPNVVPFDFEHLLNTLCEDARLRAEERKIRFIYHHNPKTPTLTKGDPERLKQILGTVLEVVLWFSQRGEIDLQLVRADGRHQWLLQIRDNNSTLDEAEIRLLQEHYDERDAADSDTLHRNWRMACALARLLEGDITITPETGSTVLYECQLVLPRYSLLQHHEHHYDRLLQKKRLLVVDGNRSSRLLLSQRAGNWGMQVSAAPSAEEALNLLAQTTREGECFDAVVLDFDLPAMNGLQLAEQLQRAGAPVIVMLTGVNDGPGELRARQAGISRQLHKPISEKSLKICLAEELTLRQAMTRQVPVADSASIVAGNAAL